MLRFELYLVITPERRSNMRSTRANLLSHYLKKRLVGDHRNEGVGMGNCQREGMLLLRSGLMTR